MFSKIRLNVCATAMNVEVTMIQAGPNKNISIMCIDGFISIGSTTTTAPTSAGVYKSRSLNEQTKRLELHGFLWV